MSVPNPCTMPVSPVAKDQTANPPASTQLTSKRSTSQPLTIIRVT